MISTTVVSRSTVRVVYVLAALLFHRAPALADGLSRAHEVLRDFQQAFHPAQGHMRPLGDDGWKARFRTFRELVVLGPEAAPALKESLKAASPDLRILAAQALSMTGDHIAKTHLVEALEMDSEPAVRLYAADALGRMLDPEITAVLTRVQKEDKNGDVRAHAEFALEKSDRIDPAELRKQLHSYDIAQMDRAALGEPAPLFALEDASGETVRLEDLRGKKAVLLVFIYGDT